MTRWRKGGRARPTVVMPPLPPLVTPLPLPPPRVQPAAIESPEEERLRPTDRWQQIVTVAEALAADRASAAQLGVAIGYPPEAWDQFRRDIPLRPPPEASATPVMVLVDARVAAPFLLRATLRSLQDQSHGAWRAQVRAPAALRDHPVGSFATTDPRIVFVDTFTPQGRVTPLDAGTVLDPAALAWLCFALDRTGAGAAYADHDHGIADPGLRLVRADPMLFGVYDPALIAASPPALTISDAADLPEDLDDFADARCGLLGRAERVVAVPRVLATKAALSLIARQGRATADDDRPGRMTPAAPVVPSPAAPPPASSERIAIVIPTRDSAFLLARAVDTLRATARDPARLDIVVVDNRSTASETQELFERLEMTGAARTIAFDAPFNWSLASNMGAAASDAPLIAFVNNDVELLSAGWDDALVATLADTTVGAVGARLIYPNRTIQHAGVAAGFGPLGTEHEGRGVAAADPGPGRRYMTPHAVAAVTGAFLAVRRVDFDHVGGFDAARLMIGHSDIDLCLKLRERGLTIRYEPAIEAIHHEGATRGVNETRAAIAWDEGERADLIDRWGEALCHDPGISPYWLRGDEPFALLREPTMREIVDHIDCSARPDPWRPVRP